MVQSVCTIEVLHLETTGCVGTVVALVAIQISPLRSSDGQLAKRGHSDEGSPSQVTLWGGGCLSSFFKAAVVGPYLQSECRRALNNVPSNTELSLMLSE